MATSIAKLAILLTTDTSGMQRGFAQGGQEVTRFEMRMSAASAAMAGAFGGAVHAGVNMLTGAIKSLAMEALAAEFAAQRLDAALGAMLENAQKGIELRKAIEDLDKGLIPEEDLGAAARKFSAVGTGPQTTINRLRMLSDISIATGQSVDSLADAWIRMQADGKVTSSDLTRLQRAGIPVLEELQNKYKLTGVEIRDMADKGKISFADMEDALRRMTSEGGRFHRQMEKMSKTTEGRAAGIKDAIIDNLRKPPPWWLAGHPEISTALGTIADLNKPPPTPKDLAQDERARFVEAAEAAVKELDEAMGQQRLDITKAAEKAADEQRKKMEALKKEAEQLASVLRTPGEVMADSMATVNEMFERGLILPDVYGRAIEDVKDKFLKAGDAAGKMHKAAQGVGAAQAGTTAGFSAVQEGKRQLQAMLAEERATNKRLEEIKTIMSSIDKKTVPDAPPVFPVANF